MPDTLPVPRSALFIALAAGLAAGSAASAATKTWANTAVSDSWFAPTRWSPTGVPVAFDDIILPQTAGQYVVTYDQAPFPVPTYSSLNVGAGAILNVTAGSLSANSVTIAGRIALNNPTPTTHFLAPITILPGGVLTGVGTVNTTSLTLSGLLRAVGPGNLTINSFTVGALDFSSGPAGSQAIWVFNDPTADLFLSGFIIAPFANRVIDIQDGGRFRFSSPFTNQAGTINLSGGFGVPGTIGDASFLSGRLTMTGGSINVSTTDGGRIATISFTLSGGAVNVADSSTLTLASPTNMLSGGAITLGASSTLTVNSPNSTISGGTISLGAGAELRVAAGLNITGGAWSGPGTLVVNSGGSLAGVVSLGVDLRNSGLLAPGLSGGPVNGANLGVSSLTLTPSSTFQPTLLGAPAGAVYGVSVFGAPTALNGALAPVTPLTQAQRVWGRQWIILNTVFVVGASGDFTSFNFPTLNAGLRWWRQPNPFTYAVGIRAEADLNRDGVVNFADLNLCLANFGTSGTGSFGSPIPGDCNEDGVVNFTDLNIILAAFGTSAP